MVIWVAFFVFQLPTYAFGSGESNPEIIMDDDYRLALNDAQYKKLSKLEKQLKSKEKKLEKTKDKVAKLKKSR
jgi:hypothetical protein